MTRSAPTHSPNWLTAQAAARPDGLALVTDQVGWTFGELNERARHLAGWLHGVGIEAGDRVAVLLPNGAEYVCLIHAAAKIGAVLVPLSTRLTAAELRYPLELTVCRAALVDATSAPLLSEAMPALPVLRTNSIPPADPFTQEIDTDLAALQAIVFTSGTTGQPKGAALSFDNQWWGAFASAARIGTLPADRWLCPLPLSHVGGLALVMRCCLYGIPVVLARAGSPDALTAAIQAHQVSLVSLVPTVLHRMLAEPGSVEALRTLRLVLVGGAAASPDLLERSARLGIQVSPTYGLSEACSQVATMLPVDARNKSGSVGKPLLFTDIEILDERGNPCPPGDYGEIVVSGKTVMQGYFNNPTATAETLRGGKLHTRDIGYLDADGDLFVVQRRSDLIVSGGENVYPAEVEAVLLTHPAIEAACVVGLPSVEWGQQVAAALILKPGPQPTIDDILTHCRRSLGGYKVPRSVKFVASLPQTPSGKIQRQAVVALLAEDAQPIR